MAYLMHALSAMHVAPKKMWVPIFAPWAESLAVVILFMIASALLHDPLSLQSPFPWIWFAPILIALRYGLWPSQASIVLLVGTYLYYDPNAILSTGFQLFVLGGFLLTVICVMFQNRWGKKIEDMQEIAQYLEKRTQSTADAYHVVSLAYQRLEQQYVVQPVTLRSSLLELREMLARQNIDAQKSGPLAKFATSSKVQEDEERSIIFNRFLNILALHCSLETAAIFPVHNEKIILDPITSIGKNTPPTQEDFLIQSCIETKTVAYVKAKTILQGHYSNYLLAAPFLNQANDIEAILLIESMPFLSLNDENIGIIDVLIQYFTAGHTIKNAALILDNYPECPVDFANELQRLMQLQKKTLQDSAVVAFILAPHPHQDDYLFKLQLEKRGLDTAV